MPCHSNDSEVLLKWESQIPLKTRIISGTKKLVSFVVFHFLVFSGAAQFHFRLTVYFWGSVFLLILKSTFFKSFQNWWKLSMTFGIVSSSFHWFIIELKSTLTVLRWAGYKLRLILDVLRGWKQLRCEVNDGLHLRANLRSSGSANCLCQTTRWRKEDADHSFTGKALPKKA